MISLRVTPQGQTDQIIGNLRRSSATLSKYQEQVTTGKRLLRPSDGPADTALVRATKAEDQRLETQLSNIRDAQSILQSSEAALGEVRDILTQASDNAIAANDATNDPVMDAAYVIEIQNLIDRLLSVANRRLPDGRYLFSGTTTDQTPFVVTARDADGDPIAVAYQGSRDNVRAMVGRDQTVDTIRSGAGAFEDAFQALIGLRDDLSKPLTTFEDEANNLNNPLFTRWRQSDRSEALNQRLADLDGATQTVLARLGSQGVDSESLAAMGVRAEDLQLELRKYADALESADMGQAIVSLQAQENLFQAGLAVAARINNLSLVDYLG
jgi:flagellar hook-associated protein 3 FlgL